MRIRSVVFALIICLVSLLDWNGAEACMVPNEALLQKIGTSYGHQISLSVKKGSDGSAWYVISAEQKVDGKCKYSLKGEPIVFAQDLGKTSFNLEQRDLNHDGVEEILICGTLEKSRWIGILEPRKSQIKKWLFTECQSYQILDNNIRIEKYNYDYGITVTQSFKIGKSDFCISNLTQPFDLGMKPGVRFEFFVQCYGKSGKKKYNDSEMLKVTNRRQFQIEKQHCQFTFTSQKSNSSNAPFILEKVETHSKEIKGLGGLCVGKTLSDLHLYLDQRQKLGKNLPTCKFQANEVIVKSTDNTVQSSVEVWTFKMNKGVIVSLSVESE